MTIIVYILIGFVAGYALRALLTRKGQAGGLANMRQMRQKEENLQKLLALFSSRQQVTNDDVEAALGVSDATATNYLAELEKAGVVRQHGDTGRGVYYTLVQQ